ncbi:TIGR00266 family protein [Acetobacteraceae bacterium KSS8]|uniref:TIGR00266 family protein n=1 Tax=Endosaccharibacter trunci TaxID=2812733 RepID=A0ABT1W5K7_9PROT|nr:TIGR00266 family protein [Acetobacteraceae bacterium KSS8]
MQHRIEGHSLPVLTVFLDPNESVVAETGELSWKSTNVSLSTTLGGGQNAGFLGAVKRSVAGGGLFMTEYTAEGGPGYVAFAAKVPGAIVEHVITPGRSVMVHRHGFLCGQQGISVGLGFQRSLGAGIFGGDGFRLQQVSGQGSFFALLGGHVVSNVLAPGEQIDVHPGHVGMFEDSVDFGISMLPGIRNKLFGGDGFFVARLTGPGRVWLQTLTVPGLAHALAPYLGAETTTATAEGGLLGAAAAGIFRKIMQ